MDVAPTLEAVLHAVQTLYTNPDVIGKEKASIYLAELQKSVYAWQIADQLLCQNQSLESCYFAAQTMRSKIRNSFHELPSESYQSLKDSLIAHASKITKDTPPVIVTQLSLSIADLAVQMSSWHNSIAELINRFSSSDEQLLFLLEVLTVIPEEVNSRSLRLGDNRRGEVLVELTDACMVVLQLLKECLSTHQDSGRVQVRCFRVIGSWCYVGSAPSQVFLNTEVLTAPFAALCEPSCPGVLHEAASDCICNALYCAENLSKYPQLGQSLLDSVEKLTGAYQSAVSEDNLDKCLNYCRVFTEFANSLLKTIVESPNQGLGRLATLDMLLMCVEHSQFEVSEITFNLWYRLSEELFQANNDSLNSVFRPYFQRLVICLCRQCQLDSDHTGIPKESDDFGYFRMRASDLIKDVVFIAGSANCFNQMFLTLKDQSTTLSWRATEAALFIMSALANNIMPSESQVVPQVLEAILSMPSTVHVAVRYTSTQLLGELCEWIEHHPDTSDAVLQYLLAGLQQPALASASATSLQAISMQCKNQMINHFQGLVQIVQVMDTLSLSTEAAINLIKGASSILSRLDHSKIPDGLHQLCLCQTSPLLELVDKGETVKPGSTTDPALWLDRLAAVFRYTSPKVEPGQVHPCQSVVMEVWPVLSRTCDKYQADARITERCCRCIRFVIRCLGISSATLLSPLVNQMIQLYMLHQQSCYLYLGSVLVDEYAGEATCVTGLLDMLHAFTGPTFKILEGHNGLKMHPDTVDDLFRMCLRFIQRAPLAFLQCSVCKPLFCCAIAACSLDHKEASASVMKFLAGFMKSATDKKLSSCNLEDVSAKVQEVSDWKQQERLVDREDFELRSKIIRQLLADHGQALVHVTVNACIFCLPWYMVADVSEMLYELMLADRTMFCVWLEVTLKALPTMENDQSVTATVNQIVDFHKAITNAEDICSVTRAIQDIARLYR